MKVEGVITIAIICPVVANILYNWLASRNNRAMASDNHEFARELVVILKDIETLKGGQERFMNCFDVLKVETVKQTLLLEQLVEQAGL